MKATRFEYLHQTLIHQSIVAVAFLTYFASRDDIVWKFIKSGNTPRVLERSLFAVATLLIAVGAGICTCSRAHSQPENATARVLYWQYIGDFLYSIGLASLAPLWGFVILVAGEGLRIFRLILRVVAATQESQTHSSSLDLRSSVSKDLDPKWGRAFRREAVKWGLLLTMIVFVITLQDRLAEVLAAASFVLSLLLNVSFCRPLEQQRAHLRG